MAYNQPPQQWHQQRPPPQRYHEPVHNQGAWQDGARQDPGHGRQLQNEGYNEYAENARAYPLSANDRWLDPGYQEPYRGDANGYNGNQHYQPQYDGGRPQQQDDRFQSASPRRPGYDNPPQSPGYRSEQPRPPPMNIQKKPKPRQRILAEPVSPKEISWDNPFPTFNTKKKEHKRNAGSLDKGMNKLNLDARGGEARPHTSQEHRRREESRPHTSHAHRPLDGFDSPAIPPDQGHMARPQKQPPSDRPLLPQDVMQQPRNYGIPSAPNEHLSNSPNRPAQSYRDNHVPEFMQMAPRSNTMPEHVDYPDARRVVTAASAIQAPYYHDDFGGSAQRTRSHETPAYHEPAQQRRDYPDETSFPTPRNRGAPGSTQPELPNFDAIPPSVNDRPEVHIQTNVAPSHTQPAYQKKTYQSPLDSQPPQLDGRRTRNPMSPNGELQSPLADFNFEIPANARPNHAPAERRGMPPRQPTSPHDEYGGGNDWQQDQRQHNHQRDLWQANGQFPPRLASRPEAPMRSASGGAGPPVGPIHGQQRRDFQDPRRPVNMQDSRTRDLRADPSRIRAQQQQWDDQSYDSGSHRQDRPPQQQFDYRHQPESPQQSFPPQASFNGQQLPPPAQQSVNPPRPPPVRYHENQNQSEPNLTAVAKPRNPDALPAHPTPIRPGLSDNRSAPGTSGGQGSSSQQRAPSNPTVTKLNGGETAVVTVQELSALQNVVRNNPNDNATGFKLVKKLVEAASVLANEGGRADPKTAARNRERYTTEAYKQIKRLVAASYPDAMFYLADCYGQGQLGLAPDPKEAFKLYQSAAKLNHAPSAYRVAVCCEMGEEDGGGTRRDPLKAIQWYKRAATLGDTPAMYKMGMILLKGLLGQPKNPREALPWLKRAAERADKDNPHALHELGLLYAASAPNDNIVRDERYAFDLFKQAADLGYKYSQFRLGSAFEYGLLGCPVDPRQSISLYSKAATQAEHQSELALSGWYLTGSEPILKQSDTEAYLWARKAAISSLAKAEYAMGYFTEVGIGIAPNLDEAKRWYYRAAAQNFQKAKERLEDLKRGGGKMQKTRLSRSTVTKQQGEGECVVM